MDHDPNLELPGQLCDVVETRVDRVQRGRGAELAVARPDQWDGHRCDTGSVGRPHDIRCRQTDSVRCGPPGCGQTRDVDEALRPPPASGDYYPPTGSGPCLASSLHGSGPVTFFS